MSEKVKMLTQDSGNYEYYTPAILTGSAREVMGSINLDPASSETANRVIQADQIFTAEMDWGNDGRLKHLDGGLQKEWYGNIWMNHPFSRNESPCKPKCKKKICEERGYHTDIPLPGSEDWIKKLVSEYGLGHVNQACCITYASTSEKWFRPLLSFPQCFIYGRTNYILPNGKIKKGVTKGSVITYLGNEVDKFKMVFSRFGMVK